ncbi:Lrp/AsnC family transcriptional regulator [Aggregatibacter actinomycetemcomitans]|uniref:Lrp/AsnC family transcriptional regulator n=1 Tax=Aggregatibacter actinomycetemcomitans TaxID=714 RepID=UPI0011DB2160|nr:Lrp/AsnC family transcriptional regulator [Aggregatibacter actinomycetemcomitans]QEH44994.1 Lrp/AsnC family transcriptional regulator [Aggregatibacter actinomycetemcomitans]QEH46355.1 Lrp/AsnC family transcriptional regulator [Aggregatibacter actinomycetemcomitans]QEH48999.1 Lrp/AsnC family transcriptional regulator [Aggregatibacter actinomycetemcomitans]TYA48726.1 Lrp/AsnC family transcriptional regulator [Aggregatibacter actinomycetemcomitans]TYA50972.1 Lrp/AsnC family transcriptional reg
MRKKLFDNIDTRILKALQRNGRLQNNELAKEVGLSNSACLRRVNQLEESGVIDGYAALLHPKKLNCNLLVYVQGTFFEEDPELKERFIFEVKLIPQITECHLMAGSYDFILKMWVSDLEEFNSIKNKYLTKDIGIKTLKSEVSLKTVKSTTELPL